MYSRSNQPYQKQPVQGTQYRPYPAQPGRPQGSPPNGSYRPKRKKKHGFGWQLLKFLLVLVLIAGLGIGIYVGKTYMDVAPYTSVFLDGVTVDGIELGGMTWDEANAAVRSQIVDKLGSWYVRLKSANGFYKDITAADLGISRDPSAALEAAWAVGHAAGNNGRLSVFDLQNEIITAQSGAYTFSSVEYNADTTVIDDILQQLEERAYIEPQNAKMLSFNQDDSVEPFTFQQEVVGRQLNVAAIKQEIVTMISTFQSGEVMMDTETLYPSVTVADLEPYYSLRSLAVTPIDSASSDARNENIRIAFSKINGYIINDGGKFSFNTIVGKRSATNGFLRAFEYNYGDLVWGIGGGVCQASTTVYLAAMQAGMALGDHTAHSQKVSYTDLGLDATVSDTNGAEKDMSFRNNSGGQIFLSAHVITDHSNKKRLLCEVRIYGLDLGGITYQLSTETVKVLHPSSDPIYVYDSEGKYVTFENPVKTLSEAADGYVVDTYRNTVQGGVITTSEKLTRSTYPARQQKIAQWTQP